MTYDQWLAANKFIQQGVASNALAGLGLQQGVTGAMAEAFKSPGLAGLPHGATCDQATGLWSIPASPYIASPQLGSFAQGMVADAYRHAASFKPEVPLTRYDGMTDAQVPVTQEWIDEIQNRLVQANTEVLHAKARIYALENPLPAEQPAPDASRIWEAIVAYSSR